MSTPLDEFGLPIRNRKNVETVDLASTAHRLKIISAGNSSVGKSCLIKRYCERRFVSKYVPTVGIDFGVTGTKIDGVDVRVSFYDLAGSPVYREVRTEFYSDAQGILLVFDVTSANSFASLNDWVEEIGQPIISTSSVIVCANKIDKRGREVAEGDARLWAQAQGFFYYEVSAQSGVDVGAMFDAGFRNVLSTSKGIAVVHEVPKFLQKDIDIINQTTNAASDHARLGIRSTATKEEINKAYRTMATMLHPDKNRAPGSEEAFKLLAASRTALLTRQR